MSNHKQLDTKQEATKEDEILQILTFRVIYQQLPPCECASIYNETFSTA